MMPSETELLRRLYQRFNAHDIPAVLTLLHQDVMWANGMEGGHVHGHEGRDNGQ
jgi:ketosteroid isomerase-like protein